MSQVGGTKCTKGAYLQLKGKTAFSTSFEMFVGSVHPDKLVIPAVPVGADPKRVINGVAPLFQVTLQSVNSKQEHGARDFQQLRVLH